MVPCEFHRAQNDKGAIEAAAGGARFLAGGTMLVDLMREHIERPAALVDINRLPHRRIEITARGLEIGALARMADVAADRRVAVAYPVLVESLLASASPQIRNMASIGGNLLQRTRCTYFRDPGRRLQQEAARVRLSRADRRSPDVRDLRRERGMHRDACFRLSGGARRPGCDPPCSRQRW